MKIQDFVIYVLATWRVANLFVNETGPYGVFRRLREWTGIRHDDGGRVMEIPDNLTAQLLSCVWCFSIWIGLFTGTFWLFSPEWSLKFAVPFAMSGGAVMIEIWRTGRK